MLNFSVRMLTVLLVIGLIAAFLPGEPTGAQTADICAALTESIVAAAQEACADLAVGEVCFAAEPVALSGDVDFAAPGDRADVAAVQSVVTGAADPNAEAWGVAVMNILADLPADGEQSVTLILFGAAELTSAVDASAGPAPTLTLTNAAGYDINLRAGAGTNYPVIGTLPNRAQAVVDGRNANGDWYRIQTESGPAWAFRDLVALQGDPATLNVLADDDLLLGYTAPMQAFTLTTAPQGEDDLLCGAGSAGLLIQTAGEGTAHLQINGVDVALADGTLLVQAAPDDALQIVVLDGSAIAAGTPVEGGALVRVETGADSAEPEVVSPFAFATLEGAPVDLLPEALVCTVGLSNGADTVAFYAGPGEDYTRLANVDPAAHYTAAGQNTDADGAAWWLVTTSRGQRAWVAQDGVRALGACGAVAQVSAPSPNAPASAGGSSLVPAGQSVWMANTGVDHMGGTCTGPELALCSHLVAISPNPDGTISWRGQEPLPYTMQPAGPNSYVYNGRNTLNNANLSLTITFTSETTWDMTMITVFDNDPACTHTFYYTATRNW